MQKPLLNYGMPIVDGAGIPTRELEILLNRLSDALPIIGSGSPEGVVEAKQYSLYIDVDASPGGVEYRKLQSQVSGDTTKGWVAV